MAKVQGPEEFFEALRSAKRDDESKAAARESARMEGLAAEKPQPEAAPPSPVSKPEQQARSFPMSVFASDEPTVTIRRSTLIFAVIVVAILLFIAFAVGRRSGARAKTSRRAVTEEQESVAVRRPALPEHLRGKSVICLRTFDLTEEAGPANARAYRDFLKTSPEAAFIKSSGRQVYILTHERELQLCVGPFDGLTTPAVNELLPKLRKLRYNNVRPFAHTDVDVRPVRYYAKVFN